MTLSEIVHRRIRCRYALTYFYKQVYAACYHYKRTKTKDRDEIERSIFYKKHGWDFLHALNTRLDCERSKWHFYPPAYIRMMQILEHSLSLMRLLPLALGPTGFSRRGQQLAALWWAPDLNESHRNERKKDVSENLTFLVDFTIFDHTARHQSHAGMTGVPTTLTMKLKFDALYLKAESTKLRWRKRWRRFLFPNKASSFFSEMVLSDRGAWDPQPLKIAQFRATYKL